MVMCFVLHLVVRIVFMYYPDVVDTVNATAAGYLLRPSGINIVQNNIS